MRGAADRVVAAGGPRCRIGDEKDALFEGDGVVDRPVGQGVDGGCKAPERGPVAPRVFEQRLVLRDPHVATASLEPAVEDAGGDLAALARTGTVAEEIALPRSAPVRSRREADA